MLAFGLSLGAAFSSGAATVERYAQLFPGEATNQPLSSVGWQAHGTANGTLLGGVDAQLATASGAPDGSLSFAVGGNKAPWLLWTTEVAGLDVSQINQVRWHQGNAATSNAFRVAVKVGEQWFASVATFAQSYGIASGTAFAAQAEPMTHSFNPTASGWRQLQFVPGSSLALSAAAPASDLSGPIEAIGLLAVSVTGTLRVDSVRLVEAAARGAAWNRATIDFIDSMADGADGARAFDWNGDPHPDLVAGWEEAGEVRVYANPGPATAGSAWPRLVLAPSPGVEDALPADWDGDGRPDIAAMLEAGGERIRLWFSPANVADIGTAALWQSVDLAASVGRRWMFGIAFDVDGDGDLDLVAGGKETNGEVAWFRNPGGAGARDGSQWVRTKLTDANWIMSLHLRDMNGDGRLDLLLSDRKPGGTNRQGIRWLEHPGVTGLGGAWASRMIHAGVEVMFIEPHDVDGDGLEDILWGSVDPARLGWLQREAGGSYLARAIEMPGAVGRPKHFRPADLVPGTPLYVLTCERASEADGLSGVVWMAPPHDPAHPVWRVGEISGVAGDKFDLALLLDLDGDGALDVVTSDEGEAPTTIGLGVVWYRNPGAGALASGFTEFVEFFGLGEGVGSALEDYDGDGLTDLMEYAFGTDPTRSSAACGPSAGLVQDAAARHLALTYRQRSGGSGAVGIDYLAGGVRYRVQRSIDLGLGGWATMEGGVPGVEPVGSPLPAGDGMEWVTVRSKDPISPARPREFLRLRLTLESD